MFTPGWWKSQYGIIGDHPATMLGAAFEAIENCYLTHAGRLPSQGEISNLIEFVSKGTLVAACGHPEFTFSVSNNDEDVPRVNDIGNQGALSIYARPSEEENSDKLVNVDPKTGEHYTIRDLQEAKENSALKDIIGNIYTNVINDEDYDEDKFWDFMSVYRQMVFNNQFNAYRRVRSQFNELIARTYGEIKNKLYNKLSMFAESADIKFDIVIDNLPMLGKEFFDDVMSFDFDNINDLKDKIKSNLDFIGYGNKYDFIISKFNDNEKIILNEQSSY